VGGGERLGWVKVGEGLVGGCRMVGRVVVGLEGVMLSTVMCADHRSAGETGDRHGTSVVAGEPVEIALSRENQGDLKKMMDQCRLGQLHRSAWRGRHLGLDCLHRRRRRPPPHCRPLILTPTCLAGSSATRSRHR